MNKARAKIITELNGLILGGKRIATSFNEDDFGYWHNKAEFLLEKINQRVFQEFRTNLTPTIMVMGTPEEERIEDLKERIKTNVNLLEALRDHIESLEDEEVEKEAGFLKKTFEKLKPTEFEGGLPGGMAKAKWKLSKKE